MTTRVTDSALVQSALLNIRRNSAALLFTQSQLSSGHRILAPSDDPSGTSRVLDLERQAAAFDRFASNAADAASALDEASAQIQRVVDVASEVRDVMLQGLNATASATDRASIADHVDQLLQSLLAIANTSYGSRRLFAGTAGN